MSRSFGYQFFQKKKKKKKKEWQHHIIETKVTFRISYWTFFISAIGLFRIFKLSLGFSKTELSEICLFVIIRSIQVGQSGFLKQVALLKVVSATFLLVCVFSLRESTCETRNNVFIFTSKALFVLEKTEF